jgi:hypothetical protein
MTIPTPPPGTAVQAGPELFVSPPTFSGGFSTQGVPAITTPAIPATTVAVTNTTGVDVMVYLTSGGAAVTVIKINGVTTGLNLGTATTSSASYYLPAGSTTSMTYASTAPTWVWQAV